MSRDDLGQHVGSLGEDDLLLALLQPVHVDPGGPHGPPGQGLLLLDRQGDLHLLSAVVKINNCISIFLHPCIMDQTPTKVTDH